MYVCTRNSLALGVGGAIFSSEVVSLKKVSSFAPLSGLYIRTVVGLPARRMIMGFTQGEHRPGYLAENRIVQKLVGTKTPAKTKSWRRTTRQLAK